MRLRVLIVDDETLARDRLRRLLEQEPAVEIAGECASGTEAVQSIREKSPDLVFLDIHIPEIDGFGVLRALKNGHSPVIIFVTAYDKYAVQAFESFAVDYLLKPFDRDRFQRALQRGRERVAQDRRAASNRQISELIDALAVNGRQVDRLVVKSLGRATFVQIEDIDWIRGANNYAELHIGESVYLLRKTLTALEQQLAPRRFSRISRSMLVNLDRVAELRSKSHGDYVVVLRNGRELFGSRNFRIPQKTLRGAT